MKKDCYVYPAIFDYADDGISIYFPDLAGCNSCADNDEEAFFMAREAMGGWLSIAEEDNEDIPNPSKLIDVSLESNQRAVLIQVDMPIIREAIYNKSIKKTLTIPQWLNIIAVRENINFSQVLQEALMKQLNIGGN